MTGWRAGLTALSLATVAACVATGPRAVPAPEPSPTATPAPTASAIPTVAPVPSPAPTAPPPATLPSSHDAPPLIRILLERTGGAVRLPQPGRAYRVLHGGGAEWLWGPLQIEAVAVRAWQVGAFGSEDAAEAAVMRLAEALGGGAVVTREVGSDGLWRVRAVWPRAEPDDPVAELARVGFEDAFAAPGQGRVLLAGASGGVVVSGGEVVIVPAGDWPTRVGARSYYGRLELRVSGGQLLVVNVLNLESYLKGVVPIEMGPAVFPELEALKAQAVAARTYAVAHRGDHDEEGYDLCATPACQAYHGAGVRHALSDRAVDETAGLIAVHGGRPIDAMYTSTCGGHTEDAAPLFPDRAQPYLRGVPCAWERPLTLTGLDDGPWRSDDRLFEATAAAAVGLEPAAATPQAVLDRLAVLCGGAPSVLPASADPDAFADALLHAAGLASAAATLTPETAALPRLLFLTDLFRADLDPPVASWRDGWHLRAALAALEVMGVVEQDQGELVPRPDGVGIYPKRTSASELLPQPAVLYERWGSAVRPVRQTEALPGTVIERWRRGGDVLALLVRRSGGDGEADRRSAWRWWVRERTWQEVADGLGVPDLERLEITGRSATGRVVGLEAVGRSGQRRQWTGFGVRRALDLPENLFTVHRRPGPGGEELVRFLGRAWGHGVGMCQNGAYGLARAGRRFEEILATYYTGVTVARWEGDGGE